MQQEQQLTQIEKIENVITTTMDAWGIREAGLFSFRRIYDNATVLETKAILAPSRFKDVRRNLDHLFPNLNISVDVKGANTFYIAF